MAADNGDMRRVVLRCLIGAWALLWLSTPGLAQATRPGPYEIGPGDTLKVIVIGQPEMTGEFAVDPQGHEIVKVRVQ